MPHSVRTHISDAERAFLNAQCDGRSITMSKLIRTLITAFANDQRAELPHPRRTNAEALRQLCRSGNNLNQLARQANTGIVPVPAPELRAVLANVLDAVQRLG